MSIGTRSRSESSPFHTESSRVTSDDAATPPGARSTPNTVQDANTPTDRPPATPVTAPLDPRLSDLVGFADIARETGLSYWTWHNAYRRGAIRGVPVPGGAIGLLRVDVTAFLDARRNRQRSSARGAA